MVCFFFLLFHFAFFNFMATSSICILAFAYLKMPWNLSEEEAEEFLGETLDFESEDKELGRVTYRTAEKVTYGTEEGTVFLEFADDASGLSGLDTVRIEFTGFLSGFLHFPVPSSRC